MAGSGAGAYAWPGGSAKVSATPRPRAMPSCTLVFLQLRVTAGQVGSITMVALGG